MASELKKYTTFQVGGEARSLHFPMSKAELVLLLETLENPLVLGAASNVLISSSGVDEDVVITTKVNGFQLKKLGIRNEELGIKNNSSFLIPNYSLLEAECGAKGQLLARETQKAGLSGFEFLIGFPGTVGGMVYMNAGAHGQNVADTFLECEVFDLKTKKTLTLTKEDMKFAYRKSILSEKDYVLLSAKFALERCEQEKIDDILKRNIEFRKQHQPPLSLPNAGSVFKNPEGDSAGRLLDLAGAKTLTIGGAKVYDKHANFIVNFNNATSLDISQLMLNMYNMVREKYSICLEPEIKFIGKKTEKERKIWEELLNS